MNKLKELRQEKNLTQSDLGKIFGVSKMTVLRWENGENQIKPEKAKMLAEYFGVGIGYLLGYTDDEKIYDDEQLIGDDEKIVNTVSLKRTFRGEAKESLKSLVSYLARYNFYLSNNEIFELWKYLYLVSANHGEDIKTKMFVEILEDPKNPLHKKLEEDYSLILTYEDGDDLPFNLKFD